MVRDAEEHADEDRKARELVDARNQGEAMIHGVKKSMEELGDKLDSGEKSNIETVIGELEEALKGDDKDRYREQDRGADPGQPQDGRATVRSERRGCC